MTNKPAYKCDQCSHKTIYRANLSKHKQVIHQQKINQCDKCEVITTTIYKLKHHKQYFHLGKTKDACDQCSYKATSKCKI